MTDQHEHDEHDDIRRLLADARHDEPIPGDVADRLDRVLAQLAAGDAVPGGEPVAKPAPVVDLALQRRRSRARQLLIAAAAVVAVGVGVGQLDLGVSGSSDGAGSAADMAAPEAPGGDGELESGSERPAQADRDSYSGGGSGRDREASQLRPSGLVVTDADFAAVAERKALRSEALALAPASGYASLGAEEQDVTPSPGSGSALPEAHDSSGTSDYHYASASACGSGPYGAGSLLLVTYRRQPAVLAVRPPEGDSTVVDLLRCETGEVLRSSTVPTP